MIAPGSARIAAALATTPLQVGNGGGFAGGVQAGYNKQFDPSSSAGNPTSRVSPPAAAGEAFGAASDPGAGTTTTSITGVPARSTGFHLAPARRLPDHAEPYVTGGTASGGVGRSDRPDAGLQPAAVLGAGIFAGSPLMAAAGAGSYSSTRVGYTLGGGAEWMFAPRWSVKAEYLYYDLGRATYGVTPATTSFIVAAGPGLQSQTFGSSSVRFNGHHARLGLNYHWDWTSLAPAPAPAPSPQYAVWNGFYIGLNAGYTWAQNTGVSTVAAPGGQNIFLGSSIRQQLQRWQPSPAWGRFRRLFRRRSGGRKQTRIFRVRLGDRHPSVRREPEPVERPQRFSEYRRCHYPLQFATASRQVDWLSTSRARLGFLVTPSFLL